MKESITAEALKEMERDDSSHRWLGWMACYIGDIVARGGRIEGITTEVQVLEFPPNENGPNLVMKRPGRKRTIHIEVDLPDEDVCDVCECTDSVDLIPEVGMRLCRGCAHDEWKKMNEGKR